jgi:DNA-binding CsgD family transcriptional regulator
VECVVGNEPPLDLEARVARLTPGQRECLERVTDHATSKEIARELGISPHTVDARMRAALQTLAVSTRREAAMVYKAAMSAGGANAYQSPAYQPSRLASVGVEDHYRPQDDARGDDETDTGQPAETFEARGRMPAMAADAAVWAPVSYAPGPQFRLWGGVNDLTPAQRIIAIIVVMVVAMLAFGMLLSGMAALSDLRAAPAGETR